MLAGLIIPDVSADEYEFELERQCLRDRARKGILNFTCYTKPNYDVSWHHRITARALNKWIRREPGWTRLMIFQPPRHGKTELVTRRAPALIFGQNPDVKIIAATHTAELAEANNRDVQRIMDGPEYAELFPSTTLAAPGSKTGPGSFVRNASEFEIVGRLGSYKCTGVGGALGGRGGDYLIGDDLIRDAEQADSPKERENIWKWYTTVFDARGEGDNYSVLLSFTRWHADDLAGRLLRVAKDDPEADQWKVISFPAIKEKSEVRYDPREEGDALWPNKFPIHRLRQKRATMGTRAFNAPYQQRPSAEEGEILKRIWMQKRYVSLPVLHRGYWDELLISTDMRFKDAKNSGDYVVHQAWARLAANAYFLGEARGRWGFTESVDEFIKISKATPIGGFAAPLKLVENKANGPALENVLKNKVSGIVLEEPQGGKTARAYAVTPLWEAGNVILPTRDIYPQIDSIVEEWVSFGPGCAFDDRTDAMSQALKRLQSQMQNSLEGGTKW